MILILNNLLPKTDWRSYNEYYIFCYFVVLLWISNFQYLIFCHHHNCWNDQIIVKNFGSTGLLIYLFSQRNDVYMIFIQMSQFHCSFSLWDPEWRNRTGSPICISGAQVSNILKSTLVSKWWYLPNFIIKPSKKTFYSHFRSLEIYCSYDQFIEWWAPLSNHIFDNGRVTIHSFYIVRQYRHLPDVVFALR